MTWTLIRTRNGWVITNERQPVYRIEDAYVFEDMAGITQFLLQFDKRDTSGIKERSTMAEISSGQFKKGKAS